MRGGGDRRSGYWRRIRHPAEREGIGEVFEGEEWSRWYPVESEAAFNKNSSVSKELCVV